MAAMESAPPFDSMKVRELKNYLKANGQLITGKKEELVRFTFEPVCKWFEEYQEKSVFLTSY